jgi:DNA replication protein DnaC
VPPGRSGAIPESHPPGTPASLEWIYRAEVLVVCGPSGTGKSTFIEVLGRLASDKGRHRHQAHPRDGFVPRLRADGSVSKAIGKPIRADLAVIADVTLLPVSADAADALLRVVDAAEEKRSWALSFIIDPSRFDEMVLKILATAIVKRLLERPTDPPRSGKLPTPGCDRRQGMSPLH